MGVSSATAEFIKGGMQEMMVKQICASGAAAVLLVGVPGVPASASAGQYVAIAASMSSDAWGMAWAGSKDEATRLALSYCASDGARDCVWLARSYRCVALARRKDGRVDGGIGGTISDAESHALRDNGGGWIVGSRCTGPAPGTTNFD
jgi:Domain of unknown function (DUF4189)